MFWPAIVVVFVTAMVTPQEVWAHAKLLRSDPADGAILAQAPQEIRLWFDEDISPRFSSAQLLDIKAQPVEIAEIRTDSADTKRLVLVLSTLPEGVYSVLAKTLSEADGHVSRSLLVFGVGEGVDLGTAPSIETQIAPPPPEVLLRWANYTLLAALVGAIAIAQLVLLPMQPASETQRMALAAVQRRVISFAFVGATLALLTGIGLLFWQAASLAETLPESTSAPSIVWQILGHTRWGGLWLTRQGSLLGLAGALYSLRVQDRLAFVSLAPFPALGSVVAPTLVWSWIVADLLSLTLIGAQALTGHTAAVTPDTILALVTDAAHLLAASVWIGGLFALAVGLLPLMRGDQPSLVALARAGWGSFSRFAALSVGLLLATGLYNMGRQVASIDALITTLYGQVLLTKIGLVLAVGSVGLLNSMLLNPSVAAPVARLLGRPTGWTPVSSSRLHALLLGEAAFALLVLFATGLLTAATAPRGAEFTVAPEEVPTQLSQSVDDVVVTLAIKPNRPGQNVLTVFVGSTRRPPPAMIMRTLLRFTYLDQDLGRVSVTAREVDPGRFMIGGSYLSMAGRWQIEVAVRRKGIEDSVARFDWLVAPPGKVRPVVISKRPLASLLSLVAATLLILLTALVAMKRSVFTKRVWR